MAISVDWDAKIISVPKADTLLIQSSPTEVRQLDLDAFRLDLKALEAGEEGMVFEDTHQHVAPINVGGVTLARVVEIINNYTITFEDGQYAVNLVGANSNVGDRVNVNQVSVRSTNSAGLTFSKEILQQSFENGRVYVDTIDGLPGIQYPRGTATDPVDNLADATTIAVNNGLKSFDVYGNVTLNQNYFGYRFYGTRCLSTVINLNGQVVGTGTFDGAVVRGVAAPGRVFFNNCQLEGVENLHGNFIGCGLTSVTAPGNDGLTTIHNCYSAVPGDALPVLDLAAQASDTVQVRNYSGGLEVKNCDQPDQIFSIDITSGHIKLDSTCSAGTIVIRGTGKLTDNSTGTCVVNTEGLIQSDKIDTDIASIPANTWAYTLESGFDAAAMLRLVAAAMGGKVVTNGNNITIRDLNDTKDRLVAQTDQRGQRLSVTIIPD